MHTYEKNDPKGWCGDPARGAAMGRPTITGSAPGVKLYLRRRRLNSGGYDSRGTYFGAPDNLYWVYSEDGTVDFCVRGDSRYEAQQAALQVQPGAAFIRPAVAPTALDHLAEAAARAYLVSGYADVMENYGGSLCSGDLDAQCPPTPASVLQDYGYVFIDKLCRRNGCTPDELWVAAQQGDHRRKPTLDDLGFILAMKAMGSGVSWEDSHDPIVVNDKKFEVGYFEENPFYTHNLSRLLPAKVRRRFNAGIPEGE